MRGFCHILYSLIQFLSHTPSLLTPAHTVYCMHGWQAVWIPLKHTSVTIVRGTSNKVWHRCDGLICQSWTGIVMKWVTDRQWSIEMALHFILKTCLWNIRWSDMLCFVCRQGSAGFCQRSKIVIEPIYRASTWPSQSIYYAAQEATRLDWMIVASICAHRKAIQLTSNYYICQHFKPWWLNESTNGSVKWINADVK